jgi:uncharacterized membrane protein
MGICIGAVTATSLNMIGGAIPIWVKIIFVVPLVADGFTQLLGKRQSNNTLRLVTGFLFSAAFILSTI